MGPSPGLARMLAGGRGACTYKRGRILDSIITPGSERSSAERRPGSLLPLNVKIRGGAELAPACRGVVRGRTRGPPCGSRELPFRVRPRQYLPMARSAAKRRNSSGTARAPRPRLTVSVGPERIVLTDGLQPFLFSTRAGTLVAQAQLTYPPNHVHAERDWYPGLPGTVVSRDGGKSWRRWLPSPELRTGPHQGGEVGEHHGWRHGARGLGPIFEGAATQLRDGTILVLNYATDGPSSEGTWWAKLWESDDDFTTVRGPIYVTIDM